MHWFDKLVHFVFLPVVVISSVFSPTTNDVRIFTGVEYLADTFGIFPHNISYFFEIKPIMNHVVNFALIKFAQIFVPFPDHAGTDFILKIIALLLMWAAALFFSRKVLPNVSLGFPLVLLSMICCLNLNILQAEWWAVIFTLFSCALLAHENDYLHYIGGALLIPVLLVKGTTIALLPVVMVVVWIFRKKIDIPRTTIGFTITGLLFGIAAFTIWPEMLPDIFLAPQISHFAEYSLVNHALVTLMATMIAASIYIPIVGLGIVYGAVWAIKNKTHRMIYPFLLMWASPLVILWLQCESFAYQYYTFVIPAIVSVVLYESDTPKTRGKYERVNMIAATICVLFVMYCLLYAPWGKYGQEENTLIHYFGNQSAEINEKFDLPNETILYLDAGSGPWYFRANSTCRYICPLILQRSNANRNLTGLAQYQEAKVCAMNYTGRYILADGPLGGTPDDLTGYNTWFGNDTVDKQNLIFKIRKEYHVVSSGAWDVWERI